MRTFGIALALCATTALSDEVLLSGAEIKALLPTITAIGTETDTSQTFSVSGQTDYVSAGRPSSGSWWVRDDTYCSRWPPSDSIACYGVARDGDRLIWISPGGLRTVDRIEPR